MAKPTIGDKDTSWLARFVDRAISNSGGASLPASLVGEEIRATGKLFIDDDIELSPQAVEKLKDYLGL